MLYVGPYPVRKGEDDPSFSWAEMGGRPREVVGKDGVLADGMTWREVPGALKLRPMLFPENTLAVALDDGTVMPPEESSGLDVLELVEGMEGRGC